MINEHAREEYFFPHEPLGPIRPGLGNYTIENIHAKVFVINSFKPLNTRGKVDKKSLEEHFSRKILELPKFKHVKYVQANGSPIKIKINYNGITCVEWTPEKIEIPINVRDSLNEFKRHPYIMERNINAEKADYKILKKIFSQREKKGTFIYFKK